MTAPFEFPDQSPDVEVQHVTFRSDGIWEFIYTERRDVSPDGVLVKTLVIDSTKLPQSDIDDFMDDARQLIDEGLGVLRRGAS